MPIVIASLIILATTVSTTQLIEAESMAFNPTEQVAAADDQRSDGKRNMKGWELYVWKPEPPEIGWRFALLAGTNLVKANDEIRRDPIYGVEELRDAVANLAEGQWVTLYLSDVDDELLELSLRIEAMIVEHRLRFVRVTPVMPYHSDHERAIDQNDPIWKALRDHQVELAAVYKERLEILPVFGEYREIETPRLKSLFPHLRFAAIVLNQYQHPEASYDVHRAAGLRSVAVVDRETNTHVHTLHGMRIYLRDFGELLARDQVTIDSIDDAQAVWDAYLNLSIGERPLSIPRLDRAGVWQLHAETIERRVGPADGEPITLKHTVITEILTDPETKRVLSARTRRVEDPVSEPMPEPHE